MDILVTIPDIEFRNKVFTKQNIEKLNNLGNVKWNNKKEQFTEDELICEMQNMDALITGWSVPTITKDMISQSRVKFVGHIGGSLKGIISKDVFQENVTIVNGNDAFGRTVAEHNLMMHLIGARRAYDFINNMKCVKNSWCDSSVCVDGLNGKTIGIIGYGTITKWLIQYLKPFDIEILVFSEHLASKNKKHDEFELVTLGELLKRADYVNIQTSLTPKTYHLIGKEELQMMKDGSILVNAARGAIIDQEALINELDSGRLFAILDVYEEEPLPKDSRLRELDNVYCFPHIGGKTNECRENLAKIVINALQKLINDEEIEEKITIEIFNRMTDSANSIKK